MLVPELMTTNLNVFCYGLKEVCEALPATVIDGYIEEIKEHTQNQSAAFIYFFVLSSITKTIQAPNGHQHVVEIKFILDIFITHEDVPFKLLGDKFRHIGQVPDIQAGIFNRLPPIFNRHYEYKVQHLEGVN